MRLLRAILLLTLALTLAVGVPADAASTATSTVAVTVAGGVVVDPAQCATSTLNKTDFGSIVSGASYVTSIDCEVLFGSSNDTSMLRLFQADGGGDAMVPGPSPSATLGWWPLNGSGIDLSPNANPVVLGTNPADPAFVAGQAQYGQALQFDVAGDDTAVAATNPAYDVTSFTVDTWVRNTDPSAIIAARQTGDCGNPGLCQFELWLGAGGLLHVNIEVGGVQHSAVGPAMVDGAWHHVAATVDDATKTLTLYRDGVQVAVDSTWNAGSADTGAAPIYLGRSAVGSGALNNGDVDEFRFQAGVRTPQQIQQYAAARVEQYGEPTQDWNSAAASTRMFGACLRAVVDGAATDGSTWTPNATCPQADASGWRPIVATGGTAGSKIATAPLGDQDAKARLRFGLRIPTTQLAGSYVAPLTFEVVAPAV